jgi:H+/gluconate symporter-like permease
MTREHYLRAIAGSLVLVSLALGYIHSPYWHLFTAFVGLNLVQSAFTKWCLMETILEKIGVGKGADRVV